MCGCNSGRHAPVGASGAAAPPRWRHIRPDGSAVDHFDSRDAERAQAVLGGVVERVPAADVR